MRSPHNGSSGTLELDPVDELTEDERLRVDLLLDALVQDRLEYELAGQDDAVRAIAARVRPRRRRPAITLPRLGLAFLIPRRPAAGLAVAACLFAATTGAAFAGVLPSAAQRVAHRALHRLGVDVPGGAQHHSPQDAGPGTSAGGASGGGVSSTARDGSISGRDKGAKVSKTASNGKSRAGDDHGASGDPAGPPDTTGDGGQHPTGGSDNGQGTTHSQSGSGDSNGQGTTRSQSGSGNGQGTTYGGGGTQPTHPTQGGGSGGQGAGGKSTHSTP